MFLSLYYRFRDLIRILFMKTFTIKIYMKSGNVIVLKYVSECDFKKRGDEYTSLEWKQVTNARMNSIVLSQIEAITQEL